MVNFAIVGCGAITTVRHAPECLKSDKINLSGVFDVDSERCRRVAELFGCKAYNTYDELLQDESVDGVVICVSNTYHCDMTVKALKHKKHVLCEKPIAVTLEEAELMINTAKAEDRYLMIAHNQRLCPTNRKVKELINSGKLGRIISFRTVFAHGGPEVWSVDKSSGTWFLNKTKAGLGALGDIGIHKADLMRWLLGEEIKQVTSVVGTLDKKDAEGEPISIEDNAFAILETESGIIGTLEASWTHYGRVSNEVELRCEKGIIKAIDEQWVTVCYKDGRETETFEFSPTDSGIVEAFADSIINKLQPEISGEEGLKALAIVLACVESSNTRKRVEI